MSANEPNMNAVFGTCHTELGKLQRCLRVVVPK